MEFCNDWIYIKDPENTEITEENICSFCKADKDECGEWNLCCYSQVEREIRAYLKRRNMGIEL